MPARKLRTMRQRVQVVFQDPFSSLNPRMKVRDILAEPLINFGMAHGRKDLTEKVAALMDKVRLPRDADQPVPARILRWPAAADRHRSGAGAWRGSDHLR